MFSPNRKLLAAAMIALMAAAAIGCAAPGAEMGGEHGTAGEGGEGGEESGTRLAPDETYDEVRKGARLILRYDQAAEEFVGTVENTTGAMLQQVRVEVHLSNGVELGPTEPKNLAAGATMDVTLPAKGQQFTGWSPHAEVGPQSGGEHGPGGEGGGGGGEHGSGGDGGREGGGR